MRRLSRPRHTYMRFSLLCFVLLSLASCSSTNIPPVVIQAEDFNRGNAVRDKGEHGYGQGIGVILTLQPSAFAEYDFKAPKTANYVLEMRYASAGPRPIRVLFDGQTLTDRAGDAATGGFLPGHQQWKEQGVVSLLRGNHTLRIESPSLFPHIDQIRLTATRRAPTGKSQ